MNKAEETQNAVVRMAALNSLQMATLNLELATLNIAQARTLIEQSKPTGLSAEAMAKAGKLAGGPQNVEEEKEVEIDV